MRRKNSSSDNLKAKEARVDQAFTGHEFFMQLFDNAFHAIIVDTNTGAIIRANNAACKLFGYQEKELQKSGSKLIIDFTDKQFKKLIAERKKRGWVTGEVTAIMKNGSKLPIEFSSKRMGKFKGKEIYCTLSKDISFRKQRENELSWLINNTEEAFILLDKKLNIVSYNKQFEVLYKKYLGMVVQQGANIIDYAQAERKEIAKQIYNRVLKGKHEQSEITIKPKSGDTKIFRIKYVPAYDDQRKIIGVFVTTADITKEYRAEQNLKKTLQALNERIKEQSCLYKISSLSSLNLRVDELLKRAVVHIPKGWRFPEIASAAIRLGNEVYKTENFKKTRWLLTAGKKTSDNKVLEVTVSYLKNTAEFHEEVFLKEEVQLINTIANNLALNIEQIIARENLYENNQKLSTILDSEPECVKIVSPDGVLLDMNPAGLKMIEASDNPNKAIGKKVSGLIHPKDKAAFIALHKKALSGRQAEARFRIIGLKGTLRWMESNAVPMRDKHGKINAVLSVTRDISAKIKAEENLKTSEEKYRTLFNTSPLPKWIYRIDNLRILDVNATAIRHYGYSRYEFLSMRIKELHPKTEVPNVIKAHENIHEKSGNINFGVFTHQKKNGELMRMDVHGHKLQYQGQACIMVVCIDVTARESVMQELQSSNERYELISKASRDVLYEWDVVKDVFTWGENFYSIFGHKKKNIAFRLSNWAKLMHPDDNLKNQKTWEEFIADKKQYRWNKEFRFKKGNGTYAYVEENAYLLRDSKGRAMRMIGVLSDVTETKKSEIQKQVRARISLYFKQRNKLRQSLQQVLKYITELNSFKAAEIWLCSHDKHNLHLAATYAIDAKSKLFYLASKNLTTVAIGEGIMGSILKKKTGSIWNNIQDNTQFLRKNAARQVGLKSAFGIPLTMNGDIIGVMVLISDRKLSVQDKSKTDLLNSLQNYLATEIKRKQQEEQFQLFFESSPDIMAIASTTGHFTKVNPAFCKLLGYTEEEITSQPFNNFIHPEDLNKTIVEYDETISGKRKAYNFENRYITKSGAAVWISWSSSDAFNAEGQVFAYGRNITEQRELEDLLNKATSMARIGSWELNLIKNEIYWSPMTRKIHEAPDDFVPKLDEGINFYKAGEHRERISKAVEQATTNGIPWDLELQIITYEGKERWIRTIGEAEFVKGKCVRLYGSFQDIHSLKIAELEKQAALHERTVILERTNDAFFIVDKNWTVVYWNRRAEEIIGINRDDLLGYNLWDKFPAAKELKFFQEYKRAFEEQMEVHFEEYFEPLGKWFEAHAYPTFENLSVFFRDITEKKQADETLKQAFEERNQILESISDNFYALDHDYRFTYLNRSSERLIGINKEEIIGKNVFDVLPIMKETNFPEKLEEVKLSGKPVKFELYSEPLESWFDESIYPRPDGGYSVFFRNISEKKKAEYALREAFEEKTTILESIGDAFFAVDKNFTVTYWNKLAESMLQTPRDKIIDKHLWDVFADAVNLPSYHNYHKALNENVTVLFEDYYEPIDRWFEISAYPSAKGLSVFFKDITERKKALEDIRISNERYEKVAKATNDAVWDWDLLSNKVTRTGEGFTNLFGYNAEEANHDDNFWTKLVHPEDIEQVVKAQNITLNEPKESYWESEYRFKKKDGNYAYVYDRGYIMRDAKGKAIRMIGATQDITHRKEYEESLKKLNTDLENYTHELAESNKELEQYAYVASHDLQEPLRMVTSFLTKLEKKYVDLLDDKGKQYIHFAVDGATRMRQIILELLEFSKVSQVSKELEPVDLNSLLSEVKLFLKQQIEDKNANIQIDKLPVVNSNPIALRQVFLNLVNNALKYSSKSRPLVIKVSATEKEKNWIFSVSDNGIGIHADYFDKIFVLFQRLHAKHEYSGTGLGLAICKKIIEKLGGKIWVESTEGEGSTFYFSIKK